MDTTGSRFNDERVFTIVGEEWKLGLREMLAGKNLALKEMLRTSQILRFVAYR